MPQPFKHLFVRAGLATLLEGAGYLFSQFQVQIQIIFFYGVLSVKSCKKVTLVTSEVPTIKLWKKNEEKGLILDNIQKISQHFYKIQKGLLGLLLYRGRRYEIEGGKFSK